MPGALTDKVILVTGAAQGIGREFALTLGAAGAVVVATDVQHDKVGEVAEEIRGGGGHAAALVHDITSEASNAEVVDKAVAEFGRIDVLVNNAAIWAGLRRTPWDELDIDEWDRVMRVNVRGVWQTSKAVFPTMRAAGGGKVIHMASIGAWGSSILHYAVSKAAVIGLTRSMAKLVGGDNITVNAIAPGTIGTEATMDAVQGHEDALNARIQTQAIKRLGQAGDLSGVLTFLCSDGADWMTGQVVVVDGGTIML
jgi:NAD(P)-dependent dehydrogenase (short-subunit alcohol dehydrogenase family)